MDDRRRLAVQENQTSRHVAEDGVLEAERDVRFGGLASAGQEQRMEICEKELRDESRRIGARELAHSQKLHDVGMTEAAHQLALLHEFSSVLGDRILVNPAPDLPLQYAVHLFDGAHGPWYLCLQDFSIRSIPENSPCGMNRVDLILP